MHFATANADLSAIRLFDLGYTINNIHLHKLSHKYIWGADADKTALSQIFVLS